MMDKLGLFLDMSTKSSGWCILNMDACELVDYGRIEKYKKKSLICEIVYYI